MAINRRVHCLKHIKTKYCKQTKLFKHAWTICSKRNSQLQFWLQPQYSVMTSIRTVATSLVVLRWLCCDRKSRAAYAQSFALWQQATIEFTCHDHSVIACSRHIYMVLFFMHIPFVVNHTINAKIGISDRNKMMLWPGCEGRAEFSLHTKNVRSVWFFVKRRGCCCNHSGGVALIVWFTTNRMCAKNKNIFTWREQAIKEWSRRVISIVACCHSATLCAHAARDFRSQQYQRMWLPQLCFSVSRFLSQTFAVLKRVVYLLHLETRKLRRSTW